MTTIKINERDERIRKLDELKKLNINPYPATVNRTHKIINIFVDFENLIKKETNISLVGRLRSIRSHGNLIFASLQDGTEKIQIVISKQEVGDDSYKIFTKLIDFGDFIEVQGVCFVTKKKEKSIMIKTWKILSKALRPLPDEYYGFKDEEERLRKRYLDILLNPDIHKIIEKKAKFWQSVRDFLIKEGFLEVETPVLENTTGGADAQPFVTHHNALDIDVYLRISMGELWQKRLMVSGIEKTFEIGRQFRNEGMSAEHAQDYTQMEFYWAYADYRDGMKLTEKLYKHIAKQVFGTLKFKIGKFDIDFEKKWETYDYVETVKKYTGIDVLNTNIVQIEKKLKELKIKYDTKGFNITRAIDSLWKYCRKQIAGPGFLIGVPVEISPLAKKDDNNPKITQRFQPIIAGSELGNGYSELNDPIDQAERFERQSKLREGGDEEAQMNDEEFVEAMEYGMPPVCGFGMSERVFSFLMNKTLRECQIFPLVKTKQIESKFKKINKKNNLKETESQELGIDYEKAKKILNDNIKDNVTKLHCRESEVIMRALAKHFNQDENMWGIIGLLHDIDWSITKEDTKNHCVEAIDILKKAGGSKFLIKTIVSHVYGVSCGGHENKQRTTQIEYALASAETVTGLIIASTLIRPNKDIKNLELKSLKKKFKNKAFAANCNREIISECEKIGLSIDKFLEISLKALQEISDELKF